MAEPWKCPECSTWIAPGVAEHRCDPGGSAPVLTGPSIAPPSHPASITVTSGDGTQWISPGSQWIGGVTVTATNTGIPLRSVG